MTLHDALYWWGLVSAAATAAIPLLSALASLTSTPVDDEAVSWLKRALGAAKRLGVNVGRER